MSSKSCLIGRICALASTAIVIVAGSSHATITVDGARDNEYGSALAVQTCGTGFGAGSGGSSLANAYAINDGTNLYVFIGGNIEGNYNKLLLFFDSKTGGQGTLNFTSGPDGSSALTNLQFDNSFEADYFMIFRWGGSSGSAYADIATLGASGAAVTSSAILSGGTASQGVSWAAINTATDGPTSSGPGGSANVTTGMEFKIPLSLIGNPTSDLKICAFVSGGGSFWVSNQFLAGLPLNTQNLGDTASGRNLATYAGNQFFTVTAPAIIDTDGDGIPDASDPDIDGDGLPNTVETNTGVFVDANNTGTNPLLADTDGDGFKDGAEVNGTSALGKVTNPLKKNYANMLVAGDFLTPSWSQNPTPQNTMSAITGDEFGWQLNYLFNSALPIKFKFLSGSWSTNWGTSATPGTAAQGGGDVTLVPGSGVFRIYFNTDTLAYSFTRATFSTYAAFAAAYGITGTSADDDDSDGLTNQQEFVNNTHPGVADTDGDGLSDASEVDGSAASTNLGAAVPTNPLSADTDGDGLPDGWEISYFLDPTDNGSAVSYTSYIPAEIGLTITSNPNGGGSDPDGDSLTNLQEYTAGSSPLAAGSGLVANNSVITIPGVFNGWDAAGTPANTMVLVGNFSWKALLYFGAPPTGSNFKFAAGSWSKNWGAQIPPNGVAVLNGGEISGASVFTAAGYYAITFNDFTLAYTLAPVASTDVDADGLPDEYEAFYGNQLPSPTTNLDPAIDYDGDGKTTAQEYAAGTNPVKDVAAPSVALAPGVDKVTWYDLGATIPSPSPADVVATDDVTPSPTVTILSPAPDNNVNGFNTIIYQATDAAGNYTLFRRVIAVGSATPGYYNLRFPASMTVNTSSSNYAYGEIFIADATAGAGQATGVNAWIGVNTNNTDPSTWDASAWTAASYIGEEGNNDNYQGGISGIGRAPGTYYYATRFQVGTNNPAYRYGGITANGVGNAWGTVLSTNTNGVVTTNVYGNGILTVQALRNVQFQVDMSVQIAKGAFNPTNDFVEVRGDFNGWNGGTAWRLPTWNTNGIYSGTFAIAGSEGSAQAYKFYGTSTNTGWENVSNRTFNLGPANGNQTLPAVYFNNESDPYGSWAASQGLDPSLSTGPTAGAEGADPDNDGYTNRQEYAFGGDPKSGTASLVGVTRSGNNLVLTWLQRTDAAANAYKVLSTADLKAGFTVDATLTSQVADAADQTGVPSGYKKRQVSVSTTSGERNFLALAF